MGEPSNHRPTAYSAYMVVAFVCSLASVGIALLGPSRFGTISDLGIWAFAAMTGFTSLIGIGISYFIYKTSRIDPRDDLD